VDLRSTATQLKTRDEGQTITAFRTAGDCARSVISEQLRHRNVQRFRGGLVFKAHRLCVSLNSRLESNKEEEGLCFIELMTSDRKLKAPREGSKCRTARLVRVQPLTSQEGTTSKGLKTVTGRTAQAKAIIWP